MGNKWQIDLLIYHLLFNQQKLGLKYQDTGWKYFNELIDWNILFASETNPNNNYLLSLPSGFKTKRQMLVFIFKLEYIT